MEKNVQEFGLNKDYHISEIKCSIHENNRCSRYCDLCLDFMCEDCQLIHIQHQNRVREFTYKDMQEFTQTAISQILYLKSQLNKVEQTLRLINDNSQVENNIVKQSIILIKELLLPVVGDQQACERLIKFIPNEDAADDQFEMGFNDIQNLHDSDTPNFQNNRNSKKNLAKSEYLEEQKKVLSNDNGVNYKMSNDSNLSMSCYNFGSLSQNDNTHQLSRSHSAPLKSGFKSFLEDSQIVINQKEKQNLVDMIKVNHNNPQNLKLSSRKIFDGKQYGMISTLLSQVIDQYPTQKSIFVMKSNYGRVFGIVSRLLIQKQKLHNDTLCDNQSFVFSLTHNTQHQLLKQNTFGVKIKSKPYHKMSRSDICIGYNFSERDSCKSCLGTFYQLPKGMEYDLKRGEIYLAGASQFSIEQIEVFILDEDIE